MTDRITNLATYLNEPYTWSVDSLNKAACESCSEKKQAKEETSCCPECHFEFEEEEAVPFLSDKIKKKLLKEHKELEEKGFPEKEMLAHSKREVKWFEEAGVPCEILTRIKKDHEILLGKKINKGEGTQARTESFHVVELTSPKHKKQAIALETKVFQGPTPDTKHHRTFGIFEGDKLVAMTRVNTRPLDGWKKDSDYDKLKALAPEVGISATAVDPDYRGRGYATGMKAYLQGKYSRIMTGTGPKSHASMPRINERLGFRPVLTRGKRGQNTQYFWSDSSSRPNNITSKVKHSLIKLSNYLDSMGHIKAADEIDLLIYNASTQ